MRTNNNARLRRARSHTYSSGGFELHVPLGENRPVLFSGHAIDRAALERHEEVLSTLDPDAHFETLEASALSFFDSETPIILSPQGTPLLIKARGSGSQNSGLYTYSSVIDPSVPSVAAGITIYRCLSHN